MASDIIALYCRVYSLFVLHKKLPALLETLQTVDQTLHLPDSHHRNDSKRIILYVAYILATLPLQIYGISIRSAGFNVHTPFFLFGLYSIYALDCSEFLFTSLCYLIQSRFGHISKKLQQKSLTTHRNSLGSLCNTVDTFTFNETTSKQPHEDALAANEILALRTAFQKLVGLTETVNAQFNVRLLASLAVCMCNVLTNLYMALLGGYTVHSGPKSLGLMLHGFFWACYFFSRLVWICVTCGFVCKDVRA